MIPWARICNSSPTVCRSPTEIQTEPQAHAALPPHTATSHTSCYRHTHRAVTTPSGLLLRALVCCRIYASSWNFPNITGDYSSLAQQLCCSVWAVSERSSFQQAAPLRGSHPGPSLSAWRRTQKSTRVHGPQWDSSQKYCPTQAPPKSGFHLLGSWHLSQRYLKGSVSGKHSPVLLGVWNSCGPHI